jgi:HAD superfamily hydrolase (TIGR01509 family)
MPFTELDAVTLDAYGTLVELADPVPALDRELRKRGVERRPQQVAAAFAAEADYYRPRSLEGRDAASLARLRRDCAAVFLESLEAELDPEEFATPFIRALRFEPLPDVHGSIKALQRRGLALAVVSNWDLSLPGRLAELSFHGLVVVTSAAAGAAKPDPRIFHHALEALGVAPQRALHIGDSNEDEQGARAAGMHFARAPLTSVLEAA